MPYDAVHRNAPAARRRRLVGVQGWAGTWIDAVGWQQERAHTAVLHALLSDHRTAGRCASELLGDRATVVGSPEREKRGPQGVGRTRADLVFEAAFDGDGEAVPVAVETKVASPVRYDQLDNTACSPARGILLAPGRAALRVTDASIAWAGDGCWRLVDVERWHEAFASAVEGIELPPWLRDYAVELEARAQAQRQALERARISGVSGSSRLLDSCAWLRAMRESLPENLSSDWYGTGELSGEALFTNLEHRWQASNGADLYLNFNARAGSVRFEVRAGGPSDSLRVLREHPLLLRAVRDVGFEPAHDRFQARWRSCSIASQDLSGVSAIRAAELVRTTVGKVDAVKEVVLKDASAAAADQAAR